jgi:DNA-binding transcriptional LysR family regulator
MDHKDGRLGFDLNLIVALDALLRERSVSGAGRRLGLSQPAMSRALARLRELCSDGLLVRSGREMLLTPRAEAIAPRVRDLLRSAGSILDEGHFNPALTRRTYTVAASDYTERILLIPSLVRLREQAPLASFVVRPAVTAEAAHAERGTVDVGIAPFPGPGVGLVRKLAWSDKYVVIGRRGGPVGRSGFNLTTYLEMEHVTVSPDGFGASAIDEVFAARAATRKVAYRAFTFSSALDVVASTDLICALPYMLLQSSGNADRFATSPFPVSVSNLNVYLIWHERFAADRGTMWLVRELSKSALALSSRLGAV